MKTKGFDYGEFDRPYLVYLDLNNEADWRDYYGSMWPND